VGSEYCSVKGFHRKSGCLIVAYTPAALRILFFEGAEGNLKEVDEPSERIGQAGFGEGYATQQHGV
jgi:hypothetical protein